MSPSNFLVYKSPKLIGKVLDIIMLLLFVFTAFALIEGNSKFHYFLICLMFAYFTYFVKLRRWVYFSEKRGYTVYQVESEWKMEDKTNESIFLTEYSKRSVDKSKREKDSSNNSFLSYMNRSKIAQPSLFESNKICGFDFLANNTNKEKTLLKPNFGTCSLKDSERKIASINQSKMHDKEKQIEKLMKESMAKYSETLKKFENANNVDFYQNMRKSMAKMKRKSSMFALEVYHAYLRNLKSIVELIEETYQVKIISRNFSDLERLHEGTEKNRSFSSELDITETIDKILNSKELLFPERKIKNFDILKAFSAKNTFATLNSFGSTSSFQSKLRILREELLNLNSYFYNQETLALSAEQIFVNLNILKECEHEPFGECFEISNDSISEEHSEKLLLLFSIARNKINEIVGDMSLTLQFHRGTFMGWIQNSEKEFEVFSTINSDLGHPHFDIKINIHPKETLHCIYGSENGYSCLLMYLWAISKRSPNTVLKNLELSSLIYEILGPSLVF